LLGRRYLSIIAVAGLMLVVPVAVYLLTYIPYFSLGHGLSDWISLQSNMYDYHAHLKAGHPYSSFWYEWPLARGAVYFYASANGIDRSEIWTIGNPVVFLGGLVGLVTLTVSAWRRRDVAIGAIPWAVFCLMAPWVLVSRELFLYHYAPVVPFLAIALAWLISARSIGHHPSWIEIATVVGGAAFAFAAMFPMLDGWYVPQSYLDRVRAWIPWVF
jgi:dolichyl-phosphate-mannose--protein O-mannosyl transferase